MNAVGRADAAVFYTKDTFSRYVFNGEERASRFDSFLVDYNRMSGTYNGFPFPFFP